MKKCSYCGKEYPDEATNCLIDGESLPRSAVESADVAAPIEPAAADIATSEEQEPATLPATSNWTEKQLLIIELVLVCLIAFGGSLFYSMRFLANENFTPQKSTNFTWYYAMMRQGVSLGLVWYLLLRRGKKFSDLGLRWAPKDFGWSILLNVGGGIAHYMVYACLYLSDLTATGQHEAGARVGQLLFGGNVFYSTLLFQFLNPFFEELIVRAYLMTAVRQLTSSATIAVFLSTFVQSSYHLYQGVPSAIAHGATFLLWSIYYAKTSRISPVILAHLYSDVGATVLYMLRQ